MENIVERLKQLKCGKVFGNISLKEYTSYRLEGTALALVYPTNTQDLMKLTQFLKTEKIKYKILGNGSNLIFCNNFYDGVLIRLSHFDHLKIEQNKIVVGAGYPLIKLAMKVSKMGLTGLEFATGIPGTVGGAVYMNAGAYQSDMGYVVREVTVLTPELQIKRLSNLDMDFHYRSSFLQRHPNYICLEAVVGLALGNKEDIMEIIEDRRRRRIESQPLDYPSAGSVFRNPPQDYAGRLVEAVGFKGKQVGGAQISEKHANFVINAGGAKGSDICTLIQLTKQEVLDKMGVDLKIEQEFVE